MSLIPKLSRFVTRSVQSKGADYFVRRRVEIIEGSADAVHALVRGTLEYEVSLTLKDHALLAACSCPYFGSNLLLCKHVWATLLAANERGLLAAADAAHPLTLEAIEPEDAGLVTQMDDRFEPGWRPWQPPARAPQRTRRDRWSRFADALEHSATEPEWRPSVNLPQQVLYIVDAAATARAYAVVIEIAGRDRKVSGEWGKPRPLKLPLTDVRRLSDALDRRLIERLHGATEYVSYGEYHQQDAYWLNPVHPSNVRLGRVLLEELVPIMAAAGRLWLRRTDAAGAEALTPLEWSDDTPWKFTLDIRRDESGGFLVDASFRRGEDVISARDPDATPADGVLVARGVLTRADDHGARQWIRELREHGPIHVPAKEAASLIEAVWRSGVAGSGWPEDLEYEDRSASPTPRLIVQKRDTFYAQARLRAALTFVYGDTTVDHSAKQPVVVDHQHRTVIRRDLDAESHLRQRLLEAGFRPSPFTDIRGGSFEITEARFAGALHALLREGWRVEAEGRVYRIPRRVDMHVASGIDWFELEGTALFDDREVPLPELLAAVKRGRKYIELGDGSFGMLPDEWLQKYGSLAALATTEGDHVRFATGQVGLLDALLAEQPAVSWDEGFARARESFSRFSGIVPADPAPGFTGQLRGYQREGLGWLQFLREAGFGGCLADDMGLGKTVMVLALLDRVREESERAGARATSLIVVPRSLLFNWTQEAQRFTPRLRLMDYTGSGRTLRDAELAEHDVVLTTYGTLRRDAARLKDVPFEYVVLDEAQAIKNAGTVSAKATRLLNARHRLALSGTPVENHVGELWSLFDFLNPGLLGAASVFQRIGPGSARQDPETLALIARGLKPFILRRTKEQVVSELPPKVEQTIYCELDAPQRRVYDELRHHYRRALMARINRDGIAKSKMHILEALLRLRQAACHPALIDKGRASEPSAKLDVLLSRIEESREEEHKALVFSQFTSFLALVRRRLDESGIEYEYLDGQTRDRAARVERFQNDPSCRLFLVSLKAGGLGLNLTAAEHVFLLDPWWNPAAESQAIDRAHRIGQTQRVFAFRLIARDTVEERVVELQNSKRALVDAILGEGTDLARTLKKEDLELLLS